MNEQQTVAPDESTGREDGRRIPAVERVLDFILAEMDAGRLQPGSRVNAARISATLGLSAAPVREALSILSGRGVLNLLPDRGAIMRPFSVREVVQQWEVIAAIGGLGVRLAAQAVARGADPGEIVTKAQEIRRDPLAVPPVEFLLRLHEWHWAVHRLAGNDFLTMALAQFSLPYWDRYLTGLIDVHANIDGYLTNYRRMHEAVIAGDAESAEAIVRYHANWSIQLIRASAEQGDLRRPRRRP